MADTAARWVDRLLPEVPWRQWVLTMPFPLRLRLAWDPELLTEVLGVFQRAIASRLRLLARRKGRPGGQHASVTAVQHFGKVPTQSGQSHCDALYLDGDHAGHPPLVRAEGHRSSPAP